MELFTLFTMLMVAGLALAHWRQGLLAGIVLLCNVVLAGLVAFNFWEPLARALGSVSARVDPYADALWLTVLFGASLVLLRVLTAQVLPRAVHFERRIQQAGGVAAGMLTGYLVAGITMCILQTLPLPRQLLGGDLERGGGIARPDHLWLGLVHHGTGRVFDVREAEWFDADGSFTHRYARYRRIGAGKARPAENRGEFEGISGTQRPDTAGQK